MRIGVAVIALGAVATAQAADETFFAISFGQPELTTKSGGKSFTTDADSDLILSAGRRSDEARIYGSLHMLDTSNSCCKLTALTASYDRYLGQGPARGIVGGTLGWANYRESGTTGAGAYSFDNSGAVYGIQLGGAVAIDRGRTEFELTWHYLRTSISGKVFGVTVDLESMSYLQLGVALHL